jgi:3-oxoacyl-[acyl-carrier-protein] synthase-1
MAMQMGNVKPEEVDYINAHATSTPVGDRCEALAIHQVFGDNGPLVSSTKSMTGHECWMAGASEVVYSLLMMQHGFVAPNVNFAAGRRGHVEDPHRNKTTIEKELNTVVSNSFGFGGTNSTLILKKFNG